jgi:hypothetical protein
VTYKRACGYAAVLGVPCLVFALIIHMPLLHHMGEAHRLAQIVLFPGWQVVHWMTGGVVARNFEYKVLMPLFIIAINVIAWGGAIWVVGNEFGELPSRRRRTRREV